MTGNSELHRVDLLFDALSDHRRRRVIVYMHNSDRDVFHLDDVAGMIASQESDPSDVTDEKRERVKSDLHHRHFPKLDGAGLVGYDAANGTVRIRRTLGSDLVDVIERSNAVEETADTADR